MAHTISNWSTIDPAIDAYIKDEEEKLGGASYTELFSERTTDRQQINEITYAGLNPMQEVGEMGNAVEDSNREGYKYTYNRQIFRKQTTFSKSLLSTDQTDTVESLARDLPRAVRYSRELKIWSILRKAWDSNVTYGDGVSLVNLSHPRKDGGTAQANTFSDGVQDALTPEAVLEAQDQQISVVSNQGNLMNVSGPGVNKCLIVGPYLRSEAFQIAGVEGPDFEPDSDSNNVNYFRKGDKFDVLVVPWLSYEAAYQAGEITAAKSAAANYYDSMWGLVDRDMAKKHLKVFNAEGEPSYDSETNKKNQSLVKYAYDHYAFGVTAWYPLFLSKGDGTTFS